MAATNWVEALTLTPLISSGGESGDLQGHSMGSRPRVVTLGTNEKQGAGRGVPQPVLRCRCFVLKDICL